MKLTLRKIGGVAGPAGAIPHTVDLDNFPAARRAHASALIDAARIFERPPRMFLATPKSWDFRYVLDVEDKGLAHRTELHLDAVDAPLRALIDWLEDQPADEGGSAAAP